MILALRQLSSARGLGDSQVDLFDGGIYGAGGFNFSSEPTNWWERLLDAGTDIARSRYGVPPAGTMITGPNGTIVRTNPDSNPAVGARVDVGIGSGGVNSVVLLGGIALVAILAVGAMRK